MIFEEVKVCLGAGRVKLDVFPGGKCHDSALQVENSENLKSEIKVFGVIAATGEKTLHHNAM